MTDAAPKRIWAEEIGTATKGGQRFRIGRWITDETASHPHEYILASEHAALIREAEARGMERAADLLLPDDDNGVLKGSWFEPALRQGQTRIRAEAAAIRAAKAAT